MDVPRTRGLVLDLARESSSLSSAAMASSGWIPGRRSNQLERRGDVENSSLEQVMKVDRTRVDLHTSFLVTNVRPESAMSSSVISLLSHSPLLPEPTRRSPWSRPARSRRSRVLSSPAPRRRPGGSRRVFLQWGLVGLGIAPAIGGGGSSPTLGRTTIAGDPAMPKAVQLCQLPFSSPDAFGRN